MALEFDPIAAAGENWKQQDWDGTEAMLAATSLTRAHQILHARIDAALAPLGLNFSRFEVLALLRFTRHGQLPMGKIGDRLQVHAASVTNTIQRLESSGFVTRDAHPEDGRTTLARLLPPGREVVEVAAAALAAIDYGLDGLAMRDRTEFTAALTDFRRANGDFT